MTDIHRHSAPVRSNRGGVLIEVSAAQAGWRFLDFRVRRLLAGQQWEDSTAGREACLVLLSGEVRVQWDGGVEQVLGPRPDVFSGYPHAVYLPSDTRFRVRASSTSELADGRAPARRRLPATVVRPEQCGLEVRGGGNATRQIVDVLPPEFPADRLLVCEVFTPGGNWSSFPPHKHDEEKPPGEVALEEIYYYRFREPEGFGFQRVYRADGSADQTMKVCDGDLVLIREGYHPFVTAFGHDAYYLNFLAGEQRSMAASDDPRYARFRDWPAPDPRVPLLERPCSG